MFKTLPENKEIDKSSESTESLPLTNHTNLFYPSLPSTPSPASVSTTVPSISAPPNMHMRQAKQTTTNAPSLTHVSFSSCD